MQNKIEHSFFFIAFMSIIIAPIGKAVNTTDGGEPPSPLMMFRFNEEKEGEKKGETQSQQQQQIRERFGGGDLSDQTSLVERSNLAQQGVREKKSSDFNSASSSLCATEEHMISGVTSAPSLSLDAIKRVIDADPTAARLIVEGNKSNPSFVAHSPWYGSMVRTVFGTSADQQARQVLRESIRQKYNPEVANRVCPPFYDREVLSASQAGHIHKMARVIEEQRSQYPLSSIRDENMSLVTYARDTALVAQAAVTQLLDVKESLWNTFKQQGMNDSKSKTTLRSHPDFMAARKDAIQATLHASEAAEVAVTALQKITTNDSSFGAQAALAAAQFHAAISKLALVTTGEEKHLDHKTAEALWSATDVHDAYKAYQNVPVTTSSALNTTGVEAVTARKEQLQQALEDLEATKNYADAVTKNIDELCRVMQHSSGSEIVPIQHSSIKVKSMMDYAVMKARQLREQLASEESFPSTRNGLALRSEDEFCREAATQRMLTGVQRTAVALKSSVSDALEVTMDKADAFLNFASTSAMKDSYLAGIGKAQQEYQSRKGMDEVE